MSHNKIARSLEDLQSMKIVGEILRFPRGSDTPGRYTVVTLEQMLHEILYCVANGPPACCGEYPPLALTVDYSPGESEEESAALESHFTNQPEKYPPGKGPFDGLWHYRSRGHHTVSCWKSEWEETESHTGWNNDITCTFMFHTEPEEMYWNGI